MTANPLNRLRSRCSPAPRCQPLAALGGRPAARSAATPAARPAAADADAARSGSAPPARDQAPVTISCRRTRRFASAPAPTGRERVHLSWAIAPGYYLYRDRIKAAASAGPVAASGSPNFRQASVKQDDYFGKQVIYHNALVATRADQARERRASAAAECDLSGLRRGRPVLSAGHAHRIDPAARGLPGAAAAQAAAPPPACRRSGAPPAAVRSDAERSRTYVSEQDRLAALIRARATCWWCSALLRRRAAARLHALRAADGADSLGPDRRVSGRQVTTRARVRCSR